jgi:hypothetical protein
MQEKEKLKLIQRVMALPEFAERLEEDDSMLPKAYLDHEEEPEGPQMKSQVRRPHHDPRIPRHFFARLCTAF